MRPVEACPVSVGVLVGVAADAVLADPAYLHPVAGFGCIAVRAERRMWRPTRVTGAVHLAATVAPVVAVAALADRRLARRPLARLGYVSVVTWAVVGAAGLRRAARRVEEAVVGQDIETARARLRALCGRDPAQLDATALRRAVLESVAENTSDAAVGPLVWAALAGPAGLVGYRAVNTLDAMVGHRSDRYERFGFAAARLDDLANLLPARLTAALAVVLAATVGGRPRDALSAWRRDAGAHPSPNAGPCEAAFAGALGVRLGGPTVYPYGASERPWLGGGRDPDRGDVERAVTLSRRVVAAATLLCAVAGLRGRWR